MKALEFTLVLCFLYLSGRQIPCSQENNFFLNSKPALCLIKQPSKTSTRKIKSVRGIEKKATIGFMSIFSTSIANCLPNKE